MTDFAAIERLVTELVAATAPEPAGRATKRRMAATIFALSQRNDFVVLGRSAATDFLAEDGPRRAVLALRDPKARDLAMGAFVAGMSRGVAATMVAYQRGEIE